MLTVLETGGDLMLLVPSVVVTVYLYDDLLSRKRLLL